MGELNPYAKFLDGRAAAEILAATPGLIDGYLNAMGNRKAAERPAPGKWSPAEIICHLADCDLAFGFRLRQTLAEDGPMLQPFDQDKWAGYYEGIPADEALAIFRAVRAWNLRLIRAALPGAANRPARHPERGTLTFQTIVETLAGHDLNHLGQLRRIAEGQ